MTRSDRRGDGGTSTSIRSGWRRADLAKTSCRSLGAGARVIGGTSAEPVATGKLQHVGSEPGPQPLPTRGRQMAEAPHIADAVRASARAGERRGHVVLLRQVVERHRLERLDAGRGAQTADPASPCVKRTPSAANVSRTGVWMFGLPMQDSS